MSQLVAVVMPADQREEIDATAACADPPKSGKDLPESKETITFLSRQAALSLGIALASLTASGTQKVWVSEYSRWRDCESTDGTTYRYGAFVRLVVHFAMIQGDIKLSLPAVTAAAELGQVEAHVTLEVKGYRPGIPKDLQLPWEPLSVSNYADVIRKASELKSLVLSDNDNIEPLPLGKVEQIDAAEDLVRPALGRVWALTQLADGHSCEETTSRLPRELQLPAVIDAVRETFEGTSQAKRCDDVQPTEIDEIIAAQLLGSVRLRD